MSDKYQKLVPGDRWVPNAELHNETIDVVQSHRAGKATQGAIGVGSRPLRILNSTVNTLRRFAVVGIGTSITGTEVDADEYRETLGFNSVAPAAADPFAILQDDAFPGTIEGAVATGETNAYVSFSSTSHTYAAPAAADYDKLASQSSAGPARILSNEIPASTQLNGGINNSVTTIVVDTADGWPDPADVGAFVILVESEKMNVTAVSGTSWTVTRAYSGTSAAVHADNTAVAFFSGVVLARVELFGTDLGEFIPTIITSPATGTATGPDFTFTDAGGVGSISAAGSTVTITFTTVTGDDVVSVSPSGTTATLAAANATALARGVVSISAQEFAGYKYFTDAIRTPYIDIKYDSGIPIDFIDEVTHTEGNTANPGEQLLSYDGMRAYSGQISGFGAGAWHGDYGASWILDRINSRFIFYGSTVGGTQGAYAITDSSGTIYTGSTTTELGLEFRGGILVGGTLSTSSITAVGTIATGVWNGTVITVPYGGTGRASHTAYAVICGGTTSTAAQQSVASVGTSGQVLTSNGAGALPSFQTISAGVPTTITVADTTDTTCFLSLFESATGDLPPKTDGGLRYNAATSNLAIGAAGASTGIISFVGTTSGTVQLKVADAAGTWALTLPTSDGDAGQFLQTDGTGVTTWAAAPVPTTITVADTNNACYIALFEAATGDLGPKTDPALLFSAATGQLTVGISGTITGKIAVKGATSGTITIQPAAAAGTWALTLPTTAGTSGYFLQTDGAGVTTWAAAAGSGDVTAASTFGTDNRAIRSDGTGKGVQASLVTIGDLGDITTPVSITCALLNLYEQLGAGPYYGQLKLDETLTANRSVLLQTADADVTLNFGGGVDQGEYSPTYTLTTNLTSVAGTSSTHLLYTRVGNCVIIFGKFAPQPTAAGTCELGISLPVASNFGNAYEAVGYALGQTTLTNCEVSADTTNDRLYMAWTSDGSSEDWFMWVKYKVI